MQFKCNTCGSSYNISDDKIRGKVVKVECRRCQKPLVVRGPEVKTEQRKKSDGRKAFESLVHSSESHESKGEDLLLSEGWYYGLDGYDDGPFLLEEMQEKIRCGMVGKEHYVWREGMEDWVPLSQMPTLARFLKPPKLPPGKTKIPIAHVPDKKIPRPVSSASAKVDPLLQDAIRKDERDVRLDAKKRREEERQRQHLLHQQLLEQEKLETEALRLQTERERSAEQKRSWQKEKQAQRVARSTKPQKDPSFPDPETRRIADHFFSTGEYEILSPLENLVEATHPTEGSEATCATDAPGFVPKQAGLSDAGSTPMALDLAQVAFEQLQDDPLAVLKQRDRPGRSELSKLTRAMVTQAGVAPGRRRIKALLQLSCILLVLAGGGAGLVYVVIGGFQAADRNPHERALKKNGSPGHHDRDLEVSGGATSEIREMLWGADGKKKSSQRSREGAQNRSLQAMSQSEKALMDFYAGQDENKPELSPRLPDSSQGAMPLGIDMSTQSDFSVGQGLASLYKQEVVPGPMTWKPGEQGVSQEQISLVINLHRRQLNRCLERQLKVDDSVSGRLEVIAKIRPNGAVQRVGIEPAKFRGTKLEECLKNEIKRWKFPPTYGQVYQARFPLELISRTP